MLVDHHTVLRLAYRRLLELDCLVVAQGADGGTAWAVPQQRQAP